MRRNQILQQSSHFRADAHAVIKSNKKNPCPSLLSSVPLASENKMREQGYKNQRHRGAFVQHGFMLGRDERLHEALVIRYGNSFDY